MYFNLKIEIQKGEKNLKYFNDALKLLIEKLFQTSREIQGRVATVLQIKEP
jgi:hypothetical protein